MEDDQPIPPPPAEIPSYGIKLIKPASTAEPAEGELPEAYGTGRLFLTPRDPRCVCAQWDLTAEQLRYHNGRAAGQHLVLRVYWGTLRGERVAELHVHPESRHWFAHVDIPGVAYVAELGYYTTAGQWHQVAVSEPVSTPAEGPPPKEQPIRFARFMPHPATQPAPAPEPLRPMIPSAAEPSSSEQPLRRPEIDRAVDFPPQAPIMPAATQPGAPTPPLSEAPPAGALQMRQAAEQPAVYFERPALTPVAALTPNPAQVQILRELTGLIAEHKRWLNSAEITELVVGERERAISSAEAAQLEVQGAVPLVSISSPAGAAGEITSPAGGALPSGKSFWFNVNAELIIYGATEPDARVTIGDRIIKLRRDGTFSYRFALPDGTYSLPITATASHGDQRRAELAFYRGTRYLGVVGAHPQDTALKTPAVENIT